MALKTTIILDSVKRQPLSELEKPIFEILEASLQSTTPESDEIAARALDRLCPPTQTPDEVETYLWTLWELLLHVARTVPYDTDRPGQETLVAILDKLRQLQSGTVKIWGVGFHQKCHDYV